jgi:hypothetical protein
VNGVVPSLRHLYYLTVNAPASVRRDSLLASRETVTIAWAAVSNARTLATRVLKASLVTAPAALKANSNSNSVVSV